MFLDRRAIRLFQPLSWNDATTLDEARRKARAWIDRLTLNAD
jgi:hypothetical protein